MRTYTAAGLVACLSLTMACGEDTPTAPTAPTAASPVLNAVALARNAPAGTTARNADADAWRTAGGGRRFNSAPESRSGDTVNPKAITGFNVYLDVQGRISLGWQQPQTTTALRGYMILEDPFAIVEYHIAPGEVCNGSSCTYVVGWLPNGTYTYKVGAVYTDGVSDGPTSTASLTLNVPLPGDIESVVLTQQFDHEPPNSVLVQWIPVQKDGASDPTVFQYDVHGPGQSPRTFTLEDCNDPAPYPCSELYEALSLDEHTWWVEGRNSAGWGGGNGGSLGVTDGTSTPFTAAWEDVPATYADGVDIRLGLRFSEEAPISYRTLRRGAIQVRGGSVRRARRAGSGNIAWNVTVRPSPSAGDVTVTLAGDKACGTTHAICTADERRLSNSPEVTIRAQ